VKEKGREEETRRTLATHFEFESMLCELLQLLFEHSEALDRFRLALFVERGNLFQLRVEKEEKSLLGWSEPGKELVQGQTRGIAELGPCAQLSRASGGMKRHTISREHPIPAERPVLGRKADSRSKGPDRAVRGREGGM
jgi:hypothetical protein